MLWWYRPERRARPQNIAYGPLNWRAHLRNRPYQDICISREPPPRPCEQPFPVFGINETESNIGWLRRGSESHKRRFVVGEHLTDASRRHMHVVPVVVVQAPR